MELRVRFDLKMLPNPEQAAWMSGTAHNHCSFIYIVLLKVMMGK